LLQAIVAILGDVEDGQPLYLKLEGQLLNGVFVEGKDVVCIIEKSDKGKKNGK